MYVPAFCLYFAHNSIFLFNNQNKMRTNLKKQVFLLCLLLSGYLFSSAQIEVNHVAMKDFKKNGFGAFLNFSFPVSDANYLTLEGGLQYYKDDYDEELALVPVLAGYRYTLNQSGTGLYVEPNAGYMFGSTTIQPANNTYSDDYIKVAGPTAGLNVGYLFEPGGIQFNVALRYEHSFGPYATNTVGLRIAHSFSFRRRDDY